MSRRSLQVALFHRLKTIVRRARRVALIRHDSREFRILIPVLIAVVSALSATVSWRAAVASMEASDLAEQATREFVQTKEREAVIRAWIAHDLRMFPRYSAHLESWDPRKRQSPEAQEQIAVGRVLSPYFQAWPARPSLDARVDDIYFDPQHTFRYYQRLELRDLGTQASHAATEAARRRTNLLVGVAIMFALSLMLFTAARFVSSFRFLLVGLGLAIAAVGVGALFMVERAVL